MTKERLFFQTILINDETVLSLSAAFRSDLWNLSREKPLVRPSQTHDWSANSEFEEDRSYRSRKKAGLIAEEFQIVPGFFRSYQQTKSDGEVADPFAPLDSTETTVRQANRAEELFKKFGVEFKNGARVVLDPSGLKMTVVQTRDQIDLIDAFMGSMMVDPPIVLSFRLEIFELPALTLLEVAESVSRHSDHTPERNAILELVKEGKSRLVTTLTVHTIPGERCKVEDINSVLAFTDFAKPVSTKGDEE